LVRPADEEEIGASTTQFLYYVLNPVQELQPGMPSANTLTGLGMDEHFHSTDASRRGYDWPAV
jgi:hypothetical protein